MTHPTPAPRPSRREFARALALAGLAPAAGSAAAPGAKVAPPADPLDAAAAALAEVVRARHGKHLADDQLKRVRASIHGYLASGRRMARVKLANADEPAFTFSAEVP
jgi:hypothetical protein